MYIPKEFEVTDGKEILAFIRANAFGQLISTVEGRLFSSHIPFEVNNNGKSLICHVAKRNPQWRSLKDQEVLVTFQGVYDYISPSWYEAAGVPTWNYQAVHVYGRPQLIDDAKKLKKIVDSLTHKYETQLQNPWKPECKETLLELVIGIEIQITDIQCKYKLSQNRSKTDRKSVMKALQESGGNKLSEAMKREL